MNLINFLDLNCAELANSDIGGIIRTVYGAIRIVVPIILILVGMVGMGKAIAQQKEDEIKKAQTLLVKQAVAALIVFLMFTGVKLLFGAVGGTETETACMDAILNKACVVTPEVKDKQGNVTQPKVKGTYNKDGNCTPDGR